MKKYYENQCPARISKTIIRVSLMVFFALFCFIGHAEAQDCYNKNRSNGVTAMRNKDYDKAIKWFEVAKKCPDKPGNNDLQAKIDECKRQKQQISQTTVEKMHEFEPKATAKDNNRKEVVITKQDEPKRVSSSDRKDVTIPTNSKNTQISDDFNDNSINTNLWMATGKDVVEREGILKLEQNKTDDNVALTSVPLSVANDRIVIERKYLVHENSFRNNMYGSHFYSGSVRIKLDGRDDNYIDITYTDDDYAKKHGTYVGAKINGAVTDQRICDNVFDQWLTEKIEIDTRNGNITYYRSGSQIGIFKINGLSSYRINTITLRFAPYGWWTGHYHHMDDFRIEGVSAENTTPSIQNNNNLLTQISDDFNGSSINTQYWTSQGDVRVSNGMLTISQSQTDKDMSLTTKELRVPNSKKIAIERRFLNHKAKNYYYGGYDISINGSKDEGIGVRCFHGDYERWYGTKFTYKINGKEDRIDVRNADFDTWINEKVIVDFGAGTMSYYIDNNHVTTRTIPGLSSKNASHYYIRFHSYGWWTGHYSNYDYIRISDVE